MSQTTQDLIDDAQSSENVPTGGSVWTFALMPE